MEDLIMNVRAYALNELDMAISLVRVEDSWHVLRCMMRDADDDDAHEVSVRSCGEGLVEIRLDRYGDTFIEKCSASDHVIARLCYA